MDVRQSDNVFNLTYTRCVVWRGLIVTRTVTGQTLCLVFDVRALGWRGWVGLICCQGGCRTVVGQTLCSFFDVRVFCCRGGWYVPWAAAGCTMYLILAYAYCAVWRGLLRYSTYACCAEGAGGGICYQSQYVTWTGACWMIFLIWCARIVRSGCCWSVTRAVDGWEMCSFFDEITLCWRTIFILDHKNSHPFHPIGTNQNFVTTKIKLASTEPMFHSRKR